MKAKPTTNSVSMLLLACAVCCAFGAAPVIASEGDSLCVHFTSATQGIHIRLVRDIAINGTLPLTLCSLERETRYDLVVSGSRLERRAGYFSISQAGTPRIRGNRIGSFVRNALLPGWGSINAGRSGAGWTDCMSIATTGYIFLREHYEYRRIEDRLENLLEALVEAESAQQKKRLREDAWRVSRELNVQNSHRRRTFAFASYLYGFQIIDPWLSGNPPRASVEAGGTIVRVEGAGSNRIKAMGLSLLRPGRGQFYQGKQARGAFFALMAAAAGIYALDQHNAYDISVSAYQENIERFNAAQSLAEKELYRDRARALWDDVAEAKRDRNVAYGVLAAVWIGGLVDTWFPGREDLIPLDVAFDIEPTRAFLTFRF